MKATVGTVVLVIVVGAYLLAAADDAVATAYVALSAGAVAVFALQRLTASPPLPELTDPLVRLTGAASTTPEARPVALLAWETALLAARVQGSGDRSLARRLTPLVDGCLRAGHGRGGDDPLGEGVLGPAWERLRTGGGATAAPLEDLEDLTRRLEAMWTPRPR